MPVRRRASSNSTSTIRWCASTSRSKKPRSSKNPFRLNGYKPPDAQRRGFSVLGWCLSNTPGPKQNKSFCAAFSKKRLLPCFSLKVLPAGLAEAQSLAGLIPHLDALARDHAADTGDRQRLAGGFERSHAVRWHGDDQLVIIAIRQPRFEHAGAEGGGLR